MLLMVLLSLMTKHSEQQKLETYLAYGRTITSQGVQIIAPISREKKNMKNPEEPRKSWKYFKKNQEKTKLKSLRTTLQKLF